jgi:signal transduction histidine kinase
MEPEKQVLIVNDVQDQLDLASLIMQKAGYGVATAEDGLEGFQLAEQVQPTLIISDVSMPRVDGLELTRMVRSSATLGDTPILLLSAVRKGDQSAAAGMRAGADDYLESPYDPMCLVAKATTLVERKRVEQALQTSENEKRQIIEALRRSEEQFLQSQKLEAVGRLAGGVAHDFNNLLTAIMGYSDIALRRLRPDDPLSTYLTEIKKAGERAASLTRQLLAFSRKQVMQPKVLDLNSVINDMQRMLQRIIGEDIELVTKLSADLGSVKVDPSHLEQVIMNLVVNARDAMRLGGHLFIETANTDLDETYSRQHIAIEPGRFVMFAVSDTGAGMSEETRLHIFEPFFTTKEVGKGTGLGLSTVYGIVKQSGGSIWVYSEKGKGTTFKVYLPRVDEGIEEYKRSQTGGVVPRGVETILIAEDAKPVRNLAKEVLSSGGYKVLESDSGGAAIVTSEQHQGPIHLLLTDVVMPGMSGRELAERLLVMNPEMRVVYMSGYTQDAIVHRGVLDGGVNFLPKPFSPEALRFKVREVLDA